MTEPHLWWQRGIIYQIYPRSLMDSNGDGIGDLPGIIRRLEYFSWLGVDAIWISPIYPSPMADFGYDVSDYTGIHPMFGTMDDMDHLLAGAHERGLRVILDLVPCHTSEAHPWFEQSRSSCDNPKRDWYLWRDSHPDGGPPNNWKSVFGGGAWEWDERTGQYYYHAFLKQQPDLNWRNPQVRASMYDAMKFWLDRGVDGFRVDVMWNLLKDEKFRDHPLIPPSRSEQSPLLTLLEAIPIDQPEVHEIVAEMRQVMDRYRERVLIGEIYLPLEKLLAYYGIDGCGAHMPFNFQLIGMPWDARVIEAAINRYEGMLPEGGWPNWVLGNHDNSRIASRVGQAQARVSAMMLLTLRGTPTMYYGDELGMHDVPITRENSQDPVEKNITEASFGRDPERTPMQWNSGPGAGFTTGEPWLPLADDHQVLNVEVERKDPDSMLSLCRRIIELRRAEDALSVGNYAPVRATGDLLAYIREVKSRRFLIVLNLGHHAANYECPDFKGRVMVATRIRKEGFPVDRRIEIGGDEGLVILLED